jgi:hypothetical protein
MKAPIARSPPRCCDSAAYLLRSPRPSSVRSREAPPASTPGLVFFLMATLVRSRTAGLLIGAALCRSWTSADCPTKVCSHRLTCILCAPTPHVHWERIGSSKWLSSAACPGRRKLHVPRAGSRCASREPAMSDRDIDACSENSRPGLRQDACSKNLRPGSEGRCENRGRASATAPC